MHANLEQDAYMHALAKRLGECRHGEGGPLVESAARLFGVSKQTIYKWLRRYGFQSGRKLRSDRGDSVVTVGEVLAVSAIARSSKRANGKQLLSVEAAIDIALENGRLSRRVAPATMLRLMRLHGCHPSQLARATAHTTMRSLHPNHVWQLDASICVLYRLRGGKTEVMDQRKFNERKPRDLAAIINERILRYAVTDHTSGSVFARYYLTAGEDQHTLFQFLMAAFHQRGQDCMYGVPMMLVWDAGSANQAHAIRALLTALAIRHWAHRPGNARAKGQVEGVHNIIERQFEGRLAFVRTESIETLNSQLEMWLRDFNGAKTHSRHGHTRWGVWQQIREDQLRLCPSVEVCQRLMQSRPELRRVNGNLTIAYTIPGYPSAQYSVAHIETVRAGDQVHVSINPYRVPNVFVIAENRDGQVLYHECEPVAEDRYGFAVDSAVFGERYKAPADRDIDEARKQINQLAYGERDTLDADNAKAKGRVAFDGAIDPFKDVEQRAADVPAFIQRRGTEMHVPNPAQTELRPLTHVQALQELRARLGRAVTRAEAARVAELYPDGVPDAEFEQLLAAIVNPTPIDQERPRLVAVK